MKQVLIQGGKAIVADVPAPHAGARNILVEVRHSCISVGTEMAGLRTSGLPLYQRALKQPENVQRVLAMVRDQGLKRTIDRVSGKLTAGSATGYSAAGVVVAIGDEVQGFAVGDRVACAGAGIANHAELIDVPVNLTVKLPDSVGTDIGSTVTLGAIALQGVRRASPTLGETAVVVGLGVLGQLTAQMLSANGCRVIGIDPDAVRLELALANGLHIGIDPKEGDVVSRIHRVTDGVGADFAVVTAATPSHAVISQAMQACRKKGRVVLVGDVGLDLNRADFYKKELDFLISSSYGPGRYDPVYEEGGQDYPIAFVRWTENRNMQAYIAMLANGAVKLERLYAPPFPIHRAEAAYDALKEGETRPMMVLLEYQSAPVRRRIDIRTGNAGGSSGKIRVAVAGASSFAQGVHLPNMVVLRDDFEVRAVMSRTGANARAVATQYQAAYCTTDFEEILADEQTDLVMIATRHDLHGGMALQALRAGKHVFVEKPLTIFEPELAEIEHFYEENPDGPMLMVGFNRRFSPAIEHIRAILARSTTPLIANYRMNAGFIPAEHWVHGPEGGGRNLGEACHIYDLFNSLVSGSREVRVTAHGIDPLGTQWRSSDNFVASVKYENGSVCTLTYTALGSSHHPKEQMEVFSDGKVFSLDDYKAVRIAGSGEKGWSSGTTQKGQLQELRALASALRRGLPWPIPLREQFQATRIAFEVDRQIRPAA